MSQDNTILDSLSPAEILGLTIIGEARGEPIQGQVAVGCVIRNRMSANPSKYHSYTTVCLEPLQFSCWNSDDPNRQVLLELANKLLAGDILSDRYLVQCMYVARGINNWAIIDNTNGAVNYMTHDLFFSDKKPRWALKVSNIREIGSQVFFNA